jgi:hypothetical protein
MLLKHHSTGEERELTLEAMQLNLLNMKIEVEQSATRELQKVRTDKRTNKRYFEPLAPEPFAATAYIHCTVVNIHLDS